jgi:hypothetical protein
MAAVVLLIACFGGPVGRLAGDGPALFRERVAPVLRARCLKCHNSQKAKGGLDLSTRKALLEGGESGPAVVPGMAAKSRLVRLTDSPRPKMPRQGKPLTPAQIADLRKWVDEGAPWPRGFTLMPTGPKHPAGGAWWSLRPLARPPVPAVKNRAWVRTPIDAFILARLEAKGLRPAPPADRATLIRRLTFDLHGLPPTPAEIDAFVNDPDERAYKKLIDRLLASPHYGERWGRHWLDVAHYGDTHGYDKDKRRDFAWPYRDYIIRSFNRDKPYNRFVREQLAGDVLFPEDPDGVIATGFIAAGPWDFVGHAELFEGTVEKEKTRVLDRDDMVSSTISTFVSMTAHCARCHDHKFDPIPQRDYYRLQAVFAGVDRGDRPLLSPAAARRKAELERKRRDLAGREAALLRKINALTSPRLREIDAELAGMRRRLAAFPPLPAGKPSPSNGYHSGVSPTADAVKWVQVDLGKEVPIDAIRLVPARPTDFPDSPGFGFPRRFRVEISRDPSFVSRRVVADHAREDFPNPGDHPYVVRAGGKTTRYVRVTAKRLWLRTNDYVFALAELQVDSKGKNVARGAAVTALDSIEAGRWAKKFLVDGFDSRNRLPDRSDPKTAAAFDRRADLERRIARREQARAAIVRSLTDPHTQAGLTRVRAELAAVQREIATAGARDMVYAVLSHAPRSVRVLHRGNVEQPRQLVGAGALSLVPELPAEFTGAAGPDEGRRRAALASWVADRRNVLTWRSVVNRVWHHHFGRGIVDTPNDFGRNGSLPMHPELLDWLAVEFRDGGQSFKELHRLILRSNVYRQASRHDPACARLDADNRLLWRMNRQRLDAESIRDAVLAVSGRMDWRMGGPAFELFRFKDGESPVYDHGALEKINDPRGWRRAVYRFTVRSVPNPFLECLDCADPNINTPVRNTTLTALQALALLNDPFMIRQAEFFAERLKRQSPDPGRRIEAAYRLAFGRPPRADERALLAGYAKKHGLVNACRLLFNANEFLFID